MTYWERRQQQLNEQLEKDEAALKKRLSTYYNQEARRLEKEIAAYYSQYGENNVLEYRTLMESLSDGDRRLLLERMDDFAKKYPEYSHLLPVRESIYKLNRLEGLQQSVLMQQLEIGAVDQEHIRVHLEKQALRNANAAAETMGFGKNFYTENPEMIRKIVNTQWTNGKNFSERIWDNVKKLSGYLNQDLAQGFARGDSYDRLTKQLRQRFEKVSRNDAYRLIYTEGTFVMNESRAVAFEDSTETYIFRVQYDKIRRNGWRDICDDLNGKTFQWSERKPGINFPPMHTWCHCTATPHIADRASFIEEYERKHGGEQAEKVENRLNDSEKDGKLKLPRYEEAIIPDAKLSSYALNPEKAPDKAQAFQQALGYNLSNYQELIKNIRRHLPEAEAIAKGDNGFGMRYEIKMNLTGPNGKSAKVLTAWIDDEATGEMRLTSVYIDKR